MSDGGRQPGALDAPAGAGLASALDVLDGPVLSGLDDADLLDVAAGWQRLSGWATARQAAVAAELGRRRAWSSEHAHAAVELGARLGLPGSDADRVMARGAGLARFPQVEAALVSGRVEVGKVDLLLTAGKSLTVEQRAAAIEQVLPQAPERSRGWVRERMLVAARRHQTRVEQARSDRDKRAVFLDPVDGDTTAWLSARLCAQDAAAAWAVLDTAGRAIKNTLKTTSATTGTGTGTGTGSDGSRPGKADRSLDHARADALVAILTGRLVVPTTPACAPAETPEAGTAAAADAGARDGDVTGAGSASGAGSSFPVALGDAADSDTPGPAPAAVTATTITGAAGAAGGGATPMLTPVPGFTPGVPRTTLPAPGTGEQGCVCGGCLCGAATITVLPVKASVQVTIAASTLHGADDEPGHLTGYGPIDADTAARLARDGTWRRLVTDPTTGILTDHSTHTYAPGTVLRAAVVARDVTCQFPLCERPAITADLDHVRPFDHTLDPATLPPGAPGQTRAANLNALCRRHHNGKTHHGWTARREPTTGVTVWTSPTGHQYTRPASQHGTPTTAAKGAPGVRTGSHPHIDPPSRPTDDPPF